VNHATALAGLNAARYVHRRGLPMPIVFLCEDNGIGISVETPPRWIEEVWAAPRTCATSWPTARSTRSADAAADAVATCRRTRAPVFLHLRCVRLWGHAGSDVETTYRTTAEIESIEAQDPLLRKTRGGSSRPARRIHACSRRSSRTRASVRAASEEAARRPKLATRAAVVAPLAAYDEERIRRVASQPVDDSKRAAAFGSTLPEATPSPTRRTLAAHVNSALADELLRRPEMVVFGEDVGRKGGVYAVTAGLQKRFGPARVFDTLLDETTILGVAQGMAHVGYLPVPEIQYLAYLHNALDQLRGEACSLSFFSNGQYTNPMVVRVQGLGYQKGFGGHFHNDNSVGALRDIPGLLLAVPARGDDAARMLRGALAIARACGRSSFLGRSRCTTSATSTNRGRRLAHGPIRRRRTTPPRGRPVRRIAATS
jgi:2-oxoisovalerate dehydrogenase E1 component